MATVLKATEKLREEGQATSPSLSVSRSNMAGEYKYSIMIITIVLSFALQNMPTALCRLKGHYNVSMSVKKSTH